MVTISNCIWMITRKDEQKKLIIQLQVLMSLINFSMRFRIFFSKKKKLLNLMNYLVKWDILREEPTS